MMIPRIDGLLCERCGVPLKDGGSRCYPCRDHPSKILIRGATVYNHVMRGAIHRFKYGGRRTLADSFSVLLDSAWSRFSELHSAQLLIPVPLYRTTLQMRGYNQAGMLAEHLSRRSAMASSSNVLVRSRATSPQFRLSKSDRWQNMDDAFSVLNPEVIQRKKILLIDDVCTTGATLTECAKALREAGSGQVNALVLARDL